MKKLFLFVLIAVLFTACEKPIDEASDEMMMLKSKSKCTTIQSGQLIASDGSIIETGYDKWGYNYQALVFNGFYGNYSRPKVPVTDGDKLVMKWNDAWLSNMDCDGDKLLDKPTNYKGTGAWCTNHISGEYEVDGKKCKWTYFVKIVAVPLDAVLNGVIWYNADDVEIGQAIWGDFAIIQEVWNDPCEGVKGILYKSPDHAGLGNW